jgi:hypothetical protein
VKEPLKELETPATLNRPQLVHSIRICRSRAILAASNEFQIRMLEAMSRHTNEGALIAQADSTISNFYGKLPSQSFEEPPSEKECATEFSASVSVDGSVPDDAVCISDWKRPPDKPPPVGSLSSSARFTRSTRSSQATGSSLALTPVEKGNRVHQEQSCCSSKRAVNASVSATRLASPGSVSASARCRPPPPPDRIHSDRTLLNFAASTDVSAAASSGSGRSSRVSPTCTSSRRASKEGHQATSRGSSDASASRTGVSANRLRRRG